MSPITSFGLLAVAGIAAAIPHAHNHRLAHQHLHARDSSQSHVSMPSCWSSCFEKYNVGSESSLCESSIGSSVKSCIDTSCINTPGAVKQYNSWASGYCSASAGATGTASSGTVPPVYPTTTWTGPVSPVSPTNTATGYWSTSVCTETSTLIYRTTTSYSTYLVTHTVTVPQSPVVTSPVTSTVGAWGGEGETCGDVTVTTKVYATVTVTAGSWGGEGQASPTSNGWSPQESQAQSTEWQASTQEASTQQATSPAAYTPASSPSSTQTALVSVGLGGGSSTGSSATSTPTTSTSGPFAKRGLAYNDASDCSPFYGNSQIGWAYNWGSLPQGLDTSAVSYIPMLWSNGEPFVSYWNENAETCLASGAEYFFSFNEPDMPSQANMSPTEAAEAWMQYMEPYAGKVKLVAPAVTNGVGSGLGLDWLTQFLAACSSCTIDAVNQHWYDSAGNDLAYFQQQISQIASTTGKPVFVSEFAGIGSDSELISFMDQALEWMDSQDTIIGYSYYMVGNGFLNNGAALSPLGQAYNSN